MILHPCWAELEHSVRDADGRNKGKKLAMFNCLGPTIESKLTVD